MKYVPPYGRESEGDSAGYINGNPAAGIQGSIPPAAAFEHPMRELVGVISKSKLIPTETDLLQLAKGVRSQVLNYCVDTGSANVLSTALDPPLGSYTAGLPLRVRVKATNTGASSIDAGAGRVPIRRPDGSDVQADDLPANGIVDLVHDGTLFQMVNYLGGASTGDVINNFNKIPYTVDIGTPGVVIANFTPAITTLTAGDLFEVKIKNTNPGAAVININGIGNKNILPNGGGTLLQGDLAANDMVLFFYDGTQFFITPNPAITAEMQLTVGTGQQYTTVDAAMSAIARKAISKTGHVTIKLAGEVFPPISVSHPDGDRITVKGTMYPAGPPTRANFSITGSSAAARAADSNNNIAMLRGRYATEVRATATGQTLVQNAGPGYVQFVDLLVSGQNLASTVGFYALPGRQMYSQNCAAWGCQFGFFSYEAYFIYDSFACGCLTAGYETGGPGNMSMIHCGSYGNGSSGAGIYSHSFLDTRNSEYLSNANYGIVVSDHSAIVTTSDASVGNGTFDYFCSNVSNVHMTACSYNTLSPPVGYEGNVASIINQY